MNIDKILASMNQNNCQFILIGGMNFMLRHQPILTYDVDLWIEDIPKNRQRCEDALRDLQTEWGPTESSWGPVSKLPRGWLDRQEVFCMSCAFGALDVFRSVAGLDDWQACQARAILETTGSGQKYFGLSDDDMLLCQLALAAGEQKLERIQALRAAIKQRTTRP